MRKRLHTLAAAGGAALLLTGAALLPAPARADLQGYVRKADPAFNWELRGKQEHPAGTVYDLHLVSQEWQGIRWEHQLQVYVPRGVEPAATMPLYNTGGAAGERNIEFGMGLAKRIKAPFATLYHVPNQPLLGNRTEDALIAETYIRYLQTGDENWPLLFPMVKSVVRAMDALQEFSRKEWGKPVRDFVITGGSKRGWTSWLSAAAGDPRIKAIAPMVIDVLNMRAQMEYQKESFGAYSEQVHDYTSRGLVPIARTPEAEKLWKMVDPYTYRDRLTLPKLLINGNNDPYWTVDALNLYWDGLKGGKWVSYVPNAGHNLQQRGANGAGDLSRATSALAAFCRSQITGKPMPSLTWKHADRDGRPTVTVEAKSPPRGARLWVARAATRDFRRSEWKEAAATVEGGRVSGSVAPAEGRYTAFYAELDYETDGIPFHLSTQIRVLSPAQ